MCGMKIDWKIKLNKVRAADVVADGENDVWEYSNTFQLKTRFSAFFSSFRSFVSAMLIHSSNFC